MLLMVVSQEEQDRRLQGSPTAEQQQQQRDDGPAEPQPEPAEQAQQRSEQAQPEEQQPARDEAEAMEVDAPQQEAVKPEPGLAGAAGTLAGGAAAQTGEAAAAEGAPVAAGQAESLYQAQERLVLAEFRDTLQVGPVRLPPADPSGRASRAGAAGIFHPVSCSVAALAMHWQRRAGSAGWAAVCSQSARPLPSVRVLAILAAALGSLSESPGTHCPVPTLKCTVNKHARCGTPPAPAADDIPSGRREGREEGGGGATGAAAAAAAPAAAGGGHPRRKHVPGKPVCHPWRDGDAAAEARCAIVAAKGYCLFTARHWPMADVSPSAPLERRPTGAKPS